MDHRSLKKSFGFGTSWTPLGRKLLLIYGAIYVAELLFEHWIGIPIVSILQLYPIGSDFFHVWQIFTHPFIHNPQAPVGFLINCLIFYFFAAPVEHAFGAKGFLILFYLSALGAAVCGLLFSGVAGFHDPFFGMLPSLLSLIVIFGLLNPEATILLMFILPIKAKYISYGTVAMTLLTFLAKANPHGAYHLGGILVGYVYLRGPRLLFTVDFWRMKYWQWQLRRKKARFKVIEGSKNKKKDGPTYH